MRRGSAEQTTCCNAAQHVTFAYNQIPFHFQLLFGKEERAVARSGRRCGTCIFFSAPPQLHLMPRNKSKKNGNHIPKKSKSKFKSRNSLPGHQHCWCEGFNIGCGLVCGPSTHYLHANMVKQRK